MKDVVAVVRFRRDRTWQVVQVQDQELPEMARLLVERALSATEDSLQDPGVYCVRVGGEPRTPEVTATRIADAERTVVSALCRREGAEAVLVRHVAISRGEGHGPELDEKVRHALPEATANAMRDASVGEERWVELVM
ncbi:MAG: hypothetical protein AB2A00_25665 [Myxococcota bacterium]